MKFINIIAGVLTQVTAIITSAGAGDANKIVATDSNGKLDNSLMPAGLGVDQFTAVASEALSAGNLINVWNDAGTIKVRKADNTTAGKEAHGFVLAAVTLGAMATCYTADENTQVTGRTLGAQQFLGVAGAMVETPPTASGSIVQKVGKALSATNVLFDTGEPVTLV